MITEFPPPDARLAAKVKVVQLSSAEDVLSLTPFEGNRTGIDHHRGADGDVDQLAKSVDLVGHRTENNGNDDGQYGGRHQGEFSNRTKVGSLNMICAADVEPQPVDWLWPGRLARGKLTIIAGDPGKGKSQISVDIAARISRGKPWPDGGFASWGSVIILSAEDAPSDTIVPRLMAADADRERVHIVNSVTTDRNRRRSFSLQDDLIALGEAITTLGDVALVIIDPITSYMGEKTDSHRTTDVRAVLEPLTEWAERHKVAVLAISHPPKAAQSKAINAVSGSLAFVAAARMVFFAISEPDTERLVLLPVKNNIGPEIAGLGYTMTSHEVSDGVSTSRIVWDSDPVTITADEAVRAGPTAKSTAIDAAEGFLLEFLRAEARPATEVENAAKVAGISRRTLNRAKGNLKVVSAKDDFGGGWRWTLP